MKYLKPTLLVLCVFAINVSYCQTVDKKTDAAVKSAKEPSTDQTIQEQGETPVIDRTNNPKFSAEQRAWEKVLAENLGSFYYPLYLKSKENRSITAWDYVEDNPTLPRVLIIGDSISRGCTLPVRDALKDKVNVHRAPANCGPTRYGLEKLDVWLGDGNWDLIVFNFGIHDRNTSTEDYTANLQQLLKRLQPRAKKVIWLTSTPVPEGAAEYVAGAIDRLNAAATPLMQKENIPIIDLHAHILPKIAEYQLPKNCHFKETGYEYMGTFIAENILAALGTL